MACCALIVATADSAPSHLLLAASSSDGRHRPVRAGKWPARRHLLPLAAALAASIVRASLLLPAPAEAQATGAAFAELYLPRPDLRGGTQTASRLALRWEESQRRAERTIVFVPLRRPSGAAAQVYLSRRPQQWPF